MPKVQHRMSDVYCLEVISDLRDLCVDGATGGIQGSGCPQISSSSANTSCPACVRSVICVTVHAFVDIRAGYVRAERTVCCPSPPSRPCVRVRVRVWQRNICAYAVVIVVKMAEGETEKEYDTRKAFEELRERFQALTTALKESSQSPLEASLHFCQEFCQVSPFSCRSSRGSLQPLWLPSRGCSSTFATTRG